jgi:hypothetical protein
LRFVQQLALGPIVAGGDAVDFFGHPAAEGVIQVLGTAGLRAVVLVWVVAVFKGDVF